jgi:hypothetical protein
VRVTPKSENVYTKGLSTNFFLKKKFDIAALATYLPIFHWPSQSISNAINEHAITTGEIRDDGAGEIPTASAGRTPGIAITRSRHPRWL